MANSQGSQPATYSFLVHSSASSSHDGPGSFDCPANPKQKRRRTSPRDHAILEAAYLKNSKPDKHERAEIVSQVELGEKEVQIWFQNRRQNDRRKSKPLQPHELLAHFRNGVPAQSPAKTEGGQLAAAALASSASRPTQVPVVDVSRPSSRSSGIHELLNPSSSAESLAIKNAELSLSQSTESLSTPPSSFNDAETVTQTEESGAPVGPTNPESLHRRKRSHEAMNNSAADVALSVESDALSQPKLTKSSSFVRLAMTVDGAVKVKTNNDPTPSPPKQRAPPPNQHGYRDANLRRSQSSVEGGFNFKDINPPIRRVGGAGFGRSRDARTWEFYCDRDSGEALSTQAEAERNGSAVGAINLIRSQSQRSKQSVLSPNRVKQNLRRTQADHFTGKPKLSRARSSMARLQSSEDPDDLQQNKVKRARHARSPSGDSDKENWAPGTRQSFNPLRRMHPSAPRSSILQDSAEVYETASDRRPPAGGKEKAKGDDLDCIQGLLSLSQGAWR